MKPKVIRVLGKDGQIEKEVEVLWEGENQIQVKDPISEVHVTYEGTEQSHLADECESDVEMPSPNTQDNL